MRISVDESQSTSMLIMPRRAIFYNGVEKNSSRTGVSWSHPTGYARDVRRIIIHVLAPALTNEGPSRRTTSKSNKRQSSTTKSSPTGLVHKAVIDVPGCTQWDRKELQVSSNLRRSMRRREDIIPSLIDNTPICPNSYVGAKRDTLSHGAVYSLDESSSPDDERTDDAAYIRRHTRFEKQEKRERLREEEVFAHRRWREQLEREQFQHKVLNNLLPAKRLSSTSCSHQEHSSPAVNPSSNTPGLWLRGRFVQQLSVSLSDTNTAAVSTTHTITMNDSTEVSRKRLRTTKSTVTSESAALPLSTNQRDSSPSTIRRLRRRVVTTTNNNSASELTSSIPDTNHSDDDRHDQSSSSSSSTTTTSTRLPPTRSRKRTEPTSKSRYKSVDATKPTELPPSPPASPSHESTSSDESYVSTSTQRNSRTLRSRRHDRRAKSSSTTTTARFSTKSNILEPQDGFVSTTSEDEVDTDDTNDDDYAEPEPRVRTRSTKSQRKLTDTSSIHTTSSIYTGSGSNTTQTLSDTFAIVAAIARSRPITRAVSRHSITTRRRRFNPMSY